MGEGAMMMQDGQERDDLIVHTGAAELEWGGNVGRSKGRGKSGEF